ncbi:MAG: hypothetical protein IT178_03435 [Acidobacteria bacterium]|nr:hypothetical protein [Acidobacteriota bacterium]
MTGNLFQRGSLFRQSRFWLFGVLLVVLPMAMALPAGATARSRAEATRRLQNVVDQLRQRLGLDAMVTVEIVPVNPFMLSVEAPKKAGAAFVLQVEERMITVLDADELDAALAHELGHVWVFTHHPFLQTERGANEVALRMVSRDLLSRVYQKVWKENGTKGDLTSFLGAEAAASARPAPHQ